MASEGAPQADKKRLQNFMNDMLKVSCVKGFKYFVMHIRSREEMICSIINEPSIPILLSASNSPSNSFSAQEKRSPLIMSQKQQKRLSGYGFINIGLPPASPSGSDEDENEDYTMFLLAAYARYNSPYVWIRTNHGHLVKLASPDSPEKDYPLLLKTTSQWAEKEVKVWHVLAELVHICCTPSPPNPFAVDFDYFDSLHLSERALASGAMVRFLQQVLASGPHHYDKKVHTDLLKITQRHFLAMMRLVGEEVKVPELLSLGHSQQHVGQSSTTQPQGPYQQTSMAQPQGPYQQTSLAQPQGPYQQTSMAQPQGSYQQTSLAQPQGPYQQTSMAQPQGPYQQPSVPHLQSSNQFQFPTYAPSYPVTRR